ncbi:MAG: lipopolysaccharide heptosyltransferase II [Candidatus Omnitrophota bacterium]|nr:lipopolysaccharide heptosyltransferase II [Candidatus Omnitrophota bacterium]
MSVIRRVLVVQPYGIGDLLFLTPVLRALRLLPGMEKVDLLLGSRTEEVVRPNPHVDEIFCVDKDLYHRRGAVENLKETWLLGRKLRANHYDLLLDYSLRGEYGFFGQFFLGIPRRAGFHYKRRGFFHTHRLKINEGFTGRHVVDFFCELAEKAGVRVEDRFLEFYIEPEDRDRAADAVKTEFPNGESRFLVVSPGGGESWGADAHFKRWPTVFFAELIVMLKGRISFDGVLVVGSPAEKELTDQLVELLTVPAVNLAGKVDLRTAAALIDSCELFLGNDGGLLHVAHARRKPVIGLYGPVDPVVYGPYPASPAAAAVFKEDLECRPCYKRFRYKSDCEHRECLQSLRPGDVMKQLERSRFLAEVAGV